MGKIRVAALGDSDQEKEKRDKRARQREEKKKREQVHIPGSKGGEKTVSMTSEEDIDKLAKMTQDQEKMEAEFAGKKVKEKVVKPKSRTKTYNTAAQKVDKEKLYPIGEAVTLLKEISLSKFVGTVELHINTVEKGIRGMITLPHGTGKKLRIAIADEALIDQVKKGVIEFDILVAHPSMMSKIAQVAKVLGPKGLMPNPKTGTISDKPEEIVKKLEGGQIQYKTEADFPIMHMVIGKMDFADKQIIENFNALIKIIDPIKIKSVTLKSTMSPGIKVQV